MNLKNYLKKWHLEKLKFNAKFLEVELNFQEADKDAAWELYIELVTRSATQAIPNNGGDENRALTSMYELFSIAREIIRHQGRKSISFTKIAVVVLNQVIRPFTTKWHKLSIENEFEDKEKCKEFRKELNDLQILLQHYSKMLADMAEVEDITNLEKL